MISQTINKNNLTSELAHNSSELTNYGPTKILTKLMAYDAVF